VYRSTPSMKTFISWVGLSITTRMVGAADSCGALGGFASGAASCARTLGELDAVGVSEPSGDVASGAVGGVGSGSCARTLGELDAVGVSEPSGDVASGAVGGVGSGCARRLRELDSLGVPELSGGTATSAVGGLGWRGASCVVAVGRLDPPVRAAEPPEVLPRHSISLSVPC
jgi:hypothetical protein